MTVVYPNLYIGAEQECNFTPSTEWAVIHACKNPCHVRAVGYRGSLPSSHPNYLILEKTGHLFLNMVDMEQALLPVYADPIMKAAMAFISRRIIEQKILIHCNQGVSRSPSIALLYLAHIGHISKDSYSEASGDFLKLYPVFNPGRGISLYMNNHWKELMV